LDEFQQLKMGGREVTTKVRETADEPQTANLATDTIELAEQLFQDYKKGTAWSKKLFNGRSGSQLIQALRLWAQKVDVDRVSSDEPVLNALELEEVVAKQAVSLALPLQTLCRWIVLVRIGVGRLRRELLGLVSMVPMPPCGSVRLGRPADHVSKTHYVVTHVLGDRIFSRGYLLRFTDQGWKLGGKEGNKWSKDLWLTPGLQEVSAIVAAKRRKMMPNGNPPKGELQNINRTCKNLEKKLKASRQSAGISTDQFSKAHGARLDLENKNIMVATLASVRALLAQTIVYKENQTLDEIAARHDNSKFALLDDPSLAGDEQEAFLYHLQRRRQAQACFAELGKFVFPRGYMVFSETGIPDHVPPEVRVELTGVSGVAVGSEYLASRFDIPVLRKHAAALPEVEDLTPLIDACGISTLHGKMVDELDEIQKDAGAAGSEDYIRYRLVGEEPADMPKADFFRKTSVRFVPMVVNFNRKRLFAEDMQGVSNGVSFAISHEDVNERFNQCQPKKS